VAAAGGSREASRLASLAANGSESCRARHFTKNPPVSILQTFRGEWDRKK
jgi:hypothetical protein